MILARIRFALLGFGIICTLFFLNGCVGSSSTGSPSLSKDQLIAKAMDLVDRHDEDFKKGLTDYFYKKMKQKAWALDPYGLNGWWTQDQQSLSQAKKKVLEKKPWLVLFAENNKLVWEENLAAYNLTSIGKGRKYSDEGNYEKALPEFIEYTNINPSDYYGFSCLAWTYYNLENFAKAESAFLQSIKNGSKWVNDYLGLYKTYYNQKKYDKANQFIDEAMVIIEKRSDDNQSKFYLSIFALIKGDKEKAVEYLKDKAFLGVHLNRSHMIDFVYKNTPADLAGLKQHDLIIELNNIIAADKPHKFISTEISKFKKGDTVDIKIKRGDDYYAGTILLDYSLGPENYPKKEYQLVKLESNQANEIVAKTVPEEPLEQSVIAKEIKLVPPKSKALIQKTVEQSVRKTKSYFRGNKWAVVIGISEYENSGPNGLSELMFADDDARMFAGKLLDMGWSKSHINLLINQQATRRNIMIALRSWLTKARPEDQVILFWAGHGYFDPSDQEKVYFATYDTELSLPVTGYRMDEVRKAIEEVGAKNTILLADTCHAGKLITRGSRGISIVPILKKMEKENDIPKGWVFMVGADTDRQAIEHTAWRNGAFTHSLLKGLDGDADGYQSAGEKDGIITLGELKAYMNTAMPDNTLKVLGVAKHPIITTSTGDPGIWNLDFQVSNEEW